MEKFTFKKLIKLCKEDNHFVETLERQDRKPLSVVSTEVPEAEYATYDITKGEILSTFLSAAYVLQHVTVRNLVSASWYKAPRL